MSRTLDDRAVRVIREAVKDAARWMERQEEWCDQHHKERCDCPNGRGLRIIDLGRALRELGIDP